jgi:hypothetical protein
MQAFAPPAGDQNPNDHSGDEVLSALRGRTGGRRFAFRYELLNASNVKLGDLGDVAAGAIEHNWLADIKRKATFRLRDTGGIDFLSDRIKPWVRLYLPPYGAQDYVEWPQGVFLLSSPTRVVDGRGVVLRDIQGYDALQIFHDDKVTDRYTVTSGTVYTTAVSTLLGAIPKNITTSSATLPTAKEWDPGTSKLQIINNLLGAVNYESLSFDENGVAVVKPYVSPQDRAAEYTFADDADGLVVPQINQGLDLFDVPNRWVLVVSNPDRPPLSSTYTNTAPASPTSTVRRQRTIVDFRTEQDAADQASLDAKVARLAFEASQVYEVIEFQTAMFPVAGGNDIYRIEHGPLGLNAMFSEHTWTMNLQVGATMSRRARRVVTV